MAKEVDIIGLWEKGKEKSSQVKIDIDKTIRSRSRGTLYWIKIILTIELWLNIAFVPLLIYLYFVDTRQPTFGSILLCVTLLYIGYYLFLIREVKNFNFSDNVRTGLRRLFGYLNFFLLHYKVVIWVSLVAGLILGFLDANNEIPLETKSEPGFWWTVIGVSIIFCGIVGAIFTFLINLIYGHKIKRLKKLVKEFQ